MRTSILALFFCILSCHFLIGQTAWDAEMMSKKEICFAGIFGQSKWNQYWESNRLRTNGNIGTMTHNSYMPMVAYGFTENINLLLMAPYVSSEASQGTTLGFSGFQDATGILKYKFYNFTIWIISRDIAYKPLSK